MATNLRDENPMKQACKTEGCVGALAVYDTRESAEGWMRRGYKCGTCKATGPSTLEVPLKYLRGLENVAGAAEGLARHIQQLQRRK
jgi:hypothetical protein